MLKQGELQERGGAGVLVRSAGQLWQIGSSIRVGGPTPWTSRMPLEVGDRLLRAETPGCDYRGVLGTCTTLAPHFTDEWLFAGTTFCHVVEPNEERVWRALRR
jgi:hypothetical protein